MSETSPLRRRLRATLASATRYGPPDVAAEARTSLAIENAAEAIEAVTGRPSDTDVARLRLAIAELETERAKADLHDDRSSFIEWCSGVPS